MPPDVDRLYTLARSVLDAVVDGYADAGADLPAHRLVTPGLPAFDCEGVYVQVERTYRHSGNVTVETPQPLTAHAGHSLTAATVAVTILRCVPPMDDQGNPPSPEDEEAAAELILTDAQRTLNILIAAEQAGDLPGCNALSFGEWLSIGPAGGLAGGILRVQAGVGR